MERLIFFFIAAGGLIAGSYMNMLIYRIPLGIRSTKGRSFCPGCKSPLGWSELVPVLSFAVLRGRCAHCKRPIGIRYPLTELLNAVLWVLCYLKFGTGLSFFACAAVCSCLVMLSAIDADHKIIPDRFHIIIALCALVLLFDTGWEGWQGKLIGAFAVSIPVLLIVYFTGGMGEGDVKLFAACGFLLGWKLILLTFLIAAVSGAVFGVVMLALKKAGRRSEIPFGPFIALGAAVSLLSGERIISFYLSFIP